MASLYVRFRSMPGASSPDTAASTTHSSHAPECDTHVCMLHPDTSRSLMVGLFLYQELQGYCI